MKKIILFLFTSLLLVLWLDGAAAPPPNVVQVTFGVDMSGETVSPNGVHIAGNFQGWDPSTTALSLAYGSVYTVTLPLSEGQYLQYQFINGNSWGTNEAVPAACGVSPQILDRFYTVTADPVTLCNVFSSCDPCQSPLPPPTPLSNWAIVIGVLLMGVFMVLRYRRRMT